MFEPTPMQEQRDTPWKILLIDDDKEDYLLTRDMLRESRGRKFEVTWASSYTTGRQELQNGSFDAVLVDYDLGPNSGIELIREAAGKGYTAPLILFTGRGNYEVDEEALQAGATMYLTKSEVNPLLLERTIRYAVERKQSEQALRHARDEARRQEELLQERNQALHHSEDRFARAFQYNPAAMTITQVAGGLYIDANQTFCQMTGYAWEEIIGHSPVELGFFSQQTRESIFQQLREKGQVHQQEIQITVRDGSPRQVLFSLDPIEVEGKACILATMIDITERKQAEAAQQQTDRLMRDFLEGTHDNFFALDRDWRFTYANAHYGEVLGFDPRELIGKNYWETFPQFMGTDLERHYRRVMAEGEPVHFQQWGKYAHGFYAVSVYPTHQGIAVFSINRTEEFLSQQRLEEERSRLQAVLQVLPVGVWIADSSGQIIGKNEQADRIWAGDAPMLEGIEKYDAYPAWDAQSGVKLHAEDYPVAVALRTGRPVGPIELRIRRFDGSQGYVLVSARPIPDGQGGLTGAVWINLDITERKQTQQALRDSEERFNKAFEASPNPIIISRLLDGKIENVNSAFEHLFGYSREEAIGKTSIELGLYANPNDREEAVRRLLAEGAVRKIELDIRNRAGETRDASLSVAVVNISGEQAMVNVIEDITAHKQAEAALRHYAEELERSNQALQDFAFIASHDLQEPLRKISMFGKRLEGSAAGRLEGEESDFLERMLNATGRMQEMVNGLLELSRVNTQAGELASLDLNQVLEEVVSDLEARIQAVEGQVRVDPLPTIEADELQMRRLFLNLISNAIKYQRPGVAPVVHVSAAQTDGQVVIRVKDNGIGIPVQDTTRIFQPFQRLHGRGTYEGTGLGLAISQKIVERHHGKIEVESQEGHGTTFVVTLPVG